MIIIMIYTKLKLEKLIKDLYYFARVVRTDRIISKST